MSALHHDERDRASDRNLLAQSSSVFGIILDEFFDGAVLPKDNPDSTESKKVLEIEG